MWSSEQNENNRTNKDFNEESFLLKRAKSVVVERYDYIKRKRFSEPQAWTYEWDGAGQLIAVSNNEQKDMGGKPVHLRFEYDALGRRTAKISVWGRSIFHRVTRFLWDGDVPLHEWTYEGSEPPKSKLRFMMMDYYRKQIAFGGIGTLRKRLMKSGQGLL